MLQMRRHQTNPVFIYKKKQISNPFPGLACRENLYTKWHKSQKNSQLKSRTRKQEQNFQMPRPRDPPRSSDPEAKQPVAEKHDNQAKQNKLFHINNTSLYLNKNHLNEYPSYPQCSTLQIDDECKGCRANIFPSISQYNVYTEANRNSDVQKSLPFYNEDMVVFKEAIKYPLCLKDTHHCDKVDLVCELLDQMSEVSQLQTF